MLCIEVANQKAKENKYESHFHVPCILGAVKNIIQRTKVKGKGKEKVTTHLSKMKFINCLKYLQKKREK